MIFSFSKAVRRAYQEGRDAKNNGETMGDNPYHFVSEARKWDAWRKGFYDQMIKNFGRGFLD